MGVCGNLTDIKLQNIYAKKKTMTDNFTPSPYQPYRGRRTRPVRKAPPSIKRFSGSVFARLAQQTRYMEPALARRWSELVGSDIAQIARPGRLLSDGPRGKTLEIIACDGSAATRLNYERSHILSAISRVLGPGTVTGIKILQQGGARAGNETREDITLVSRNGATNVYDMADRRPAQDETRPHPNNEENTKPSPLEKVLAQYQSSLDNNKNKGE